MYKRNGSYYILNDEPATSEYVLKASSPFGPYTQKLLFQNLAAPSADPGGNPHQGGIVQAGDGNWWYMAFVDSYPGMFSHFSDRYPL
jgi:hypothetical protein